MERLPRPKTLVLQRCRRYLSPAAGPVCAEVAQRKAAAVVQVPADEL